MVKEKVLPIEKVQEEQKNLLELIVHNDDVNTFDYVIETLIEVCDHTPEQAEQCTLIIHYKGKCVVKSGEYEILEPMCSEILRRGITATIN